MIDVLLARAGFYNDTSILRLHHAAGLRVRTYPGGLTHLWHEGLHPD